MNLRWRFSGGVLFSLTFHALLISALVYAYPEIKNRGEWIWKDHPLFSTEKTPESVLSLENAGNGLDIISSYKMIFPDLVIIRKQKKPPSATIKKTVPKPQYTLNNILTQVEKFPERINFKLSSNKQLSASVVSLLSLLPPASMQRKVLGNSSFISANEQNNIASFDSKELKNYLNELSKFLSEDWEVPIHLKESQVAVAIMFEINKNGKILNWELEESGSQALHNSVNNLMKNLQFLPALPKSYPENSYIFGVRFSPKILQKKDAGEK
uniref:TonB C-terminal domain-containing protein n=1 Tax=uncultured delta proteobacterium HF0200_19J16 TaxID=710831 RepID=E0XUE0_9DELT|nr:hypothetical protein [uncultured delta proteobacterium HF0200_19J16]